MKCLLCESLNISQVDCIQVKYIIDTYIRTFKTDISYLFTDKEIYLNECAECGLLFYSPSVIGDDRYYNIIQKNSWYYRAEKEEYNYASSHIKPRDTVLDIGCGIGSFSKYIPFANFTGLEFSSEAVNTGLRNGIKIVNESIEEHSTKNESKYDIVSTFQVLEHISNIKEFIQKAAVCIKPGGKLIIAVPSDESYIKFLSNAILNMPPHHISRWTDRALINLSKVISLDLVIIHHEKLESIHNFEFLSTFLERCLRLNLSGRVPLVNTGFGFFIRRNIAYRLARLISQKEIDESFLPIGHTVIAIYQKRFIQ